MDFVEKMAAAFHDELKKLAAEKHANAAVETAKAVTKKPNVLLPGVAVGALGTLALQRAHRDWKMGRAMRMQNQSY
jgi:hypothetical protein